VADLVSRSHDLGETLGNVVDLVAKRLDADVCSVYLTDSDLQHLTLRATKGLSRDSVGRVRLAFGEGLVGLVAKNRETLAIERAQEHPDFRYFPETQEERFQSLMAAPLVVRDVTTGVLVVQTVEPRRFERGDVELLRTCAQLIAPVVMNAQLLFFVAQTARACRCRAGPAREPSATSSSRASRPPGASPSDRSTSSRTR